MVLGAADEAWGQKRAAEGRPWLGCLGSSPAGLPSVLGLPQGLRLEAQTLDGQSPVSQLVAVGDGCQRWPVLPMQRPAAAAAAVAAC